jgi:hypothetical protein
VQRLGQEGLTKALGGAGSLHAPTMARRANGFKGNKAALPSKPCAVCGRPMVWRRSWARNWGAVRHCSDGCRRMKRRDG